MVIHESPSIYKNKVKFKVQRRVKPGALVYITRRRSLIDKAQKIISAKNKLKSQIIVDLDILIKNDGSILLKSKFNGPNKTLMKLQLRPDFKMLPAIKKPITKKIIENQFRKTGGSYFHIKNINIQYPGGLFAPIGELNKLRRELFEKIEEKLIAAYLPDKNKIKESHDKLNKLLPQLNIKTRKTKINKKSITLAVYADNLEILKGAVKGGCDRVHFDPFTLNAPINCKPSSNIKTERIFKSIGEAISIRNDTNTELILKLPKITSSSYLATIKFNIWLSSLNIVWLASGNY